MEKASGKVYWLWVILGFVLLTMLIVTVTIVLRPWCHSFLSSDWGTLSVVIAASFVPLVMVVTLNRRIDRMCKVFEKIRQTGVKGQNATEMTVSSYSDSTKSKSEIETQTTIPGKGKEHDDSVDIENTNYRLDFAQRCLINSQELVRAMDQKAGYMLAAAGTLTAAMGVVATRVYSFTPIDGWQFTLRAIAAVLILEYFGLAFAAIYQVLGVLIARSNTLRPDSTVHGLIFPLMLLARCEDDEEKYLAKLQSATPHVLLHEYANQITEIANIYRQKCERLNSSMGWFRAATIAWAITNFLVLVILIFI